MYAWSLSENQTSVQFRCRLIGLLLKQSLFRKHDFAACVYKVYHDYQNLGFWHLKFFSNYKNNSHTHIREEDSQKSTTFQFYSGGKSLIFSSDELCPYTSDDMHKQQYQFLQCIKKDNKQTLDSNDGNVLCNMPLNELVPKLTLKSAKKIANLHDMYMPSKILLKNAHILLENHKCKTCPDLLAIFKPYKTASNVKYQQTWYQKNKDKCAKYDK
jgi:NAD-specific glutamate dehydrogenase